MYTPTILIVEDEDNNQRLYTEAFSNAGFEVTVFQSAAGDFVDQVAALRPDIISMDLVIRSSDNEVQRDGFEAMTVLKEDPRTKDIPVFVLTNFFQADRVARAQTAGAVDYITVQGQSLQKIPEHYLRYLKNPRRYTPVHPDFV